MEFIGNCCFGLVLIMVVSMIYYSVMLSIIINFSFIRGAGGWLEVSLVFGWWWFLLVRILFEVEGYFCLP